MIKIDVIPTAGQSDEQFDSAFGCKFTVSIGIDGLVSILKAPNIHYGFFECGVDTESIGLPTEGEDCPGVYEWTCSPSYSRDWESGILDFDGFDVISSVLLWSPSEGE